MTSLVVSAFREPATDDLGGGTAGTGVGVGMGVGAGMGVVMHEEFEPVRASARSADATGAGSSRVSATELGSMLRHSIRVCHSELTRKLAAALATTTDPDAGGDNGNGNGNGNDAAGFGDRSVGDRSPTLMLLLALQSHVLSYWVQTKHQGALDLVLGHVGALFTSARKLVEEVGGWLASWLDGWMA